MLQIRSSELMQVDISKHDISIQRMVMKEIIRVLLESGEPMEVILISDRILQVHSL